MDKRHRWALVLAAALILVAVVTGILGALAARHFWGRGTPRDVERLVTDLRSEDAKVRSDAADRLSALRERGLTVDAGLLALKSAAGSFPVARDADDGGALLVAAAAARPVDAYAPVVVRSFPQYSPKARYWAFSLLAGLPDRKGAQSILAVLRDHTAACEGVDLAQALGSMTPDGTKELFPEILAYLGNEGLGMPVAYLTFDAVSQGSVPSDVLAAHSEALLALYGPRRALLVPRQRAEGHRWIWEDDYLEARADAGLLLDLFGHVASDGVRQELARAVTEYSDPKLMTFAAASLVRAGGSVAPEALERAASFAETRNTLFGLLEGIERAELFPGRYRTQKAFAESEMVQWLAYPTELGQVPDEIELMKIVTAGTAGDEQDYYVYRFRMHEPHWAAKHGWMAGVAGAFARSSQPTTEAQGDTFSSFEAWDSQTPEEHVGAATKLIGEAWERKGGEARDDPTP